MGFIRIQVDTSKINERLSSLSEGKVFMHFNFGPYVLLLVEIEVTPN